jgi:hypothetical protein
VGATAQGDLLIAVADAPVERDDARRAVASRAWNSAATCAQSSRVGTMTSAMGE